MKKEGIAIDAITIQNEPLNSKNTPSMQWQLNQQMVFLRDHLYAAFTKAGLRTKVLLFDHNTDRPDYPLALFERSGDLALRRWRGLSQLRRRHGRHEHGAYGPAGQERLFHRADDHRSARQPNHQYRAGRQTDADRHDSQLEQERHSMEPGRRSAEQTAHR